MKKQINEKIKANYITIFYIGVVLLFCLIFNSDFIGEAGENISSGVLKVFGYFGYIAVGLLVALSFSKVVFDFRIFKAKKPLIYVGSVLFVVVLATSIDVVVGGSFAFGGLVSQYISMPFRTIFGNVGASILLIILAVIIGLYLTVQTLSKFGIKILELPKAKAENDELQDFASESVATNDMNLRIEKAGRNQLEIASGIIVPEAKGITISDMTVSLQNEEEEERAKVEVVRDIVQNVVAKAILNNSELKAADAKVEVESYVPPKLSNFKNEDRTVQKLSESELYENAKIITSVLSTIKIESKVSDVIIGTSIIRYELTVKNSADIVRVERVKKALLSRLQIETLSIEAPILGKDRVGIDTPNPYRQSVSLKRLLEDKKFQNSTSTTVAIGRDITGGAILCDLAKMPHLLVAGSTGMGKSVCLNAMIVSLLFHANPEDVKLILIDPKRVEFNMYQNIPHLMQDTVCESEGAINVLTRAVEETENRYKLFAQCNVRDIDSYNLTAPKKLPKIIIIIDELAELMMSGDLKKEIECQIQRLAQKARAAGVHLVVATQRPSVDVITGVIKSNLPSRIAFKLSNGVDSKTIIDESGAEDLLGKGDMFYKPSNVSKKMRVQGAYVSDAEIQAVVNDIKSHSTKPDDLCDDDVCDDIDIEAAEEEKDSFEIKVWKHIKEFKEISIGELQQIYEISYSHALNLLEEFKAQGIVELIEDEKYAVVG